MLREQLWLRALIVYPFVIFLLRFLGRTLQFQARPYDIAVQVLIGSAAANLIVNQDVAVWRAFTGLGMLAIMHTALSFIGLYNPLKKYLVGEPLFVVENGQILKANLLRHQVGVEELVAALREKGYHRLDDVEHAMLEVSGKLSVVPKSQARPVTPRDLHLPTNYEGYTTVLVADGRVDTQNLEKNGLSENWLLTELLARGVEGPEDVLFASLDTQGQLLVVRNQDVPFLQAIFKGVQSQTSQGFPPHVGQKLPPTKG